MTTELAARLYLAEHEHEMADRGYAVFNPHSKPFGDLPVIYGFNNGGPSDFLSAVAMAEDGTVLGGHCCSAEGYMLHDLGILEGTRRDRHENQYQKHYPDGYRMDFVGYSDVRTHPGLTAVLQRNKEQAALASADTRPKDGDSTEIEAPLASGAVPHEDAADAQDQSVSPLSNEEK